MASVLIVDDEPNIRRMLAALLVGEGYEVRDAPDGVSGIAAAAEVLPDAVLLDLMMPGSLDGLTTLARLRERDPELPVIMMSGRAGLSDAVRATKLGAFNFLEKPLSPETVLLALFRGTGPDGLGGMETRRPIEDGIDLIRPLLRVGSEDLRYYCHVSGLPYAIDPTNEDAALRRNAVREALQALRPSFPGLDEAVARAAELVSSERAGSPRAELRHRVREALREQGQLADVDFEHVEAAVRTMENGGTGRFLMKAGVALRIERSGPAVEKSN